MFTGLRTDAQRAIQFTRSTPGIVTSLVGISSIDHVLENLSLVKVQPVAAAEYLKLIARS